MSLTFDGLKYLIDQSPDPQGVHENGVLLHANARAVDLVGMGSLDELKAVGILGVTHPDEREAVIARIKANAMRKTLAPPAESRLIRKDGRIVHVEVQTTLLQCEGRQLSLLSVRDIDERKRTEDTLQRQANQFRRAQDAAGLGVWTDSPDEPGRPPQWSPEVYELYGLSPDWKFTPEGMVGLIHPEDRVRIITARQKLDKEGATFNEDYRVVRPDGSIRWVHGRGELQLRPDGKREVTGVVMDITNRRALEEALHQSRKMEAIGRLAGGVAHDFNNLLMVMMGQLELANRQLKVPDKALAHLKGLGQAVQSAVSLTRQLLTFSRQQVVQKKPMELRQALSEVIDLVSRLIHENVRIEVAFGTQDVWVTGDRAQLDQLIMNLMVNARDAMPDGGRVKLDLSTDGNDALIRVTDEGVGMAPETRARLFEPFFTTKTTGRGTGLGLSTAYAIVEQANGRIEVESELGKGSTFTVRWPKCAEPGRRERISDKMPAVEKHGNETVLLVEDARNVRLVIAHELRELGYRVIEAEHGERAIQLLDDAQCDAQVMVTDMVMPGISGAKVLEAARQRRPELRAVLVSGYAELPAIEQALELPGVRFLQKPFQVAQLATVLREVLDTR